MTDKSNVFTALIKRDPGFMDRPLADLLPLRFMGNAAVAAYKSMLRHLDDLPLSLEEKKARLQDGQDAGRAVLMLEARIGELLPRVPDGQRRGAKAEALSSAVDGTGFSRRARYHARAIASHPREVAEVIAEAVENEDIPTKTAVLNKIAYKQEKGRHKEAEPSPLRLKGEELIYQIKLQQVISILPPKPPRHLTEEGYIKLKALALLIIKRLEVFNENEKEKGKIGIAGGNPRLLEEGK